MPRHRGDQPAALGPRLEGVQQGGEANQPRRRVVEVPRSVAHISGGNAAAADDGQSLRAGNHAQNPCAQLNVERATQAVRRLARHRGVDVRHRLVAFLAHCDGQLQTAHVPAQPLRWREVGDDLAFLHRIHQPRREERVDDAAQALRLQLGGAGVAGHPERGATDLRADRVLHEPGKVRAQNAAVGARGAAATHLVHGRDDAAPRIRQLHQCCQLAERAKVVCRLNGPLRLRVGRLGQLVPRFGAQR